MFVTFNESTKKLIKLAIEEKEALNHPYLGTEHIILAALKTRGIIRNVFNKNGINYFRFRKKLISVVGKSNIQSIQLLYTPLLKKILLNSVMEAKEQRKKYVTTDIVVCLILEEQNGSACTMLELLNSNSNKILFDIKNNGIKKKQIKKRLLLYELGTDLTSKARKNMFDPVLGREKEVRQLSEILLRRKKNNPVLVGDAGVGKTAIVEELARLIVSGKVPNYLRGKQIIALNIFSIVAGTKYRGEFEEKMKVVIKELEENKNIILFIDEVHTIVGAGGAEGAIDASNIFKPALARADIKVIGATTTKEYDKYIKPDAALSRRFQKIEIKEPDQEALTNILLKLKPVYEKHHGVKIDDGLLKDIINLSKRYLKERNEPDRSIDVLDEVCAKVSIDADNYNQKEKKEIKLKKVIKKKNELLLIKKYKDAFYLKDKENKLKEEIKKYKPSEGRVSIKDVIKVIKYKSGCPIIDKDDNAYYKELKIRLNKKIIGEKENINKFIEYLKIKNFYNKSECFPLLILGKKGTGKTYFSNVIAKEISKNIININKTSSINEINALLNKVKNNPFSAIIFDNLSLLNGGIEDVITSIIKTSKYYDSNGDKIDFSNCIIILNESIDDKKKVGFDKIEGSNNFDFIKNKIYLKEKTISDIKKIVEDKIINFDIKKDDLIISVCQNMRSGSSLSNIDELIEEEINKLVLNNL